MKKILFSLIILVFITSCESAKNLNFKNIRKECPEKKSITDILCKEKE